MSGVKLAILQNYNEAQYYSNPENEPRLDYSDYKVYFDKNTEKLYVGLIKLEDNGDLDNNDSKIIYQCRIPTLTVIRGDTPSRYGQN